MASRHISCGPTANQSEEKAIERLKGVLSGDWILMSNLQLISGHDRQPSEIDLIAVGPPGVLVIEVKHWDEVWLRENEDRAQDEARILKSKTERVGSLLRRQLPGLKVFARQFFLFTKESTKLPPTILAGAPILTLKSVHAEIVKMTDKSFSQDQVQAIVTTIQPRARLHTDGKLRNVGDYQNMELASTPTDRFHRIYRGQHRRTGEKVIVHLYDLSDTQDSDPRRLAEREFRALQELQKCRYVPRTRDSFQDLSSFPGEVCMFSIFDPVAPTLQKRSEDQKWSLNERLQFAHAAADALTEIHGTKDTDESQIVHRNLSPSTILVGAKNRPILIGFDLARTPFTRTLAPKQIDASPPRWVAPELAGKDLSRASIHSDVYALCVSLEIILTDHRDALELISQGLTENPLSRISASDLREGLTTFLVPLSSSGAIQTRTSAPRAEYWCEGTEISFKGRTFEILACLGSGGIGRTYKVAELSPAPDEGYYGIFVAKVIFNQETGIKAIQAYRRTRQHSQHPGLATIFEIADDWAPDRVMALLQWVEREPLSGLRDGLLALGIQESNLSDVASLCDRWIKDGCEALAALHSQGLVHGDVTPRNIIYSPERLVLTDYDLVCLSGQAGWTHGVIPFCSPEAENNLPISGSDDIYALAASLFSVLFDVDAPFRQANGAQQKEAGLYWSGDSREVLGELARFFDKATHADRDQRFLDAQDALQFVSAISCDAAPNIVQEIQSPQPSSIANKTPNVVPWLDLLLSVYPGSPRGNVETRGLDSAFANATYVSTALELELIEDIRSRNLGLLILCGNAGDGKTALLQRIGQAFGTGHVASEQRVWTSATPDGWTLKANLDGSAAWKDQSADQLLDDILLPFLDDQPTTPCTHLLAINDGRLLQWLDDKQAAGMRGKLLTALGIFLSNDDDSEMPPQFRFISLNHRSLVGGETGDGKSGSDFIDDLISALVGGQDAVDIWRPCLNCTGWDRCTAGPMAHLLINSADPRNLRVRERLHETLQAVHQRGNVHITARELRGVLSYVLLGVKSCQDVHADIVTMFSSNSPGAHVGNMAFNPESPFRQGELLREIAELDPALEAHSILDRQLITSVTRESTILFDDAQFQLASLRRSAFFEWTSEELEKCTGNPQALGLAGGRYLREFRAASQATSNQNSSLCERLVRGISHLEDLPPLALRRQGRVALRLPSRTPTETKFWVELDINQFRLEADLPINLDKAVPRLARQLRLTFERQNADGTESLPMNYQLFATLLQLESGEQLADTRSDDLFANLQIFTQRLALECSRSLFAWNPKEDEKVFTLSLGISSDLQALSISSSPSLN